MSAPVAAVVLAAGRGRRMGGAKHLLPVDGVPMLERVVRALAGSCVDSVTAVVRPGDAGAAALLGRLGVGCVDAESADEGRAASVRAGVRAAPEGAAVLFVLADQPFLESVDFDALIEGWRRQEHQIVQAHYDGVRGTPVLFGPRHRAELLELRGKEGGRVLIRRHPDDVLAVPLDPERGRDLDRPEDR